MKTYILAQIIIICARSICQASLGQAEEAEQNLAVADEMSDMLKRYD